MKKFAKHVFAAFACAGIVCAAAQTADAAAALDHIEKGIHIGDVDVSGMTTLEAEKAVDEYLGSIGTSKITLDALNDNKITVTAKELGLKWVNRDAVEDAAAVGKEGNIIKRYKMLKDLEHESLVFPLEYSVDDSAVQKILKDDCSAFNVEAVDATLKREDGAFVITPGQTGVKIDVKSSADMIRDYMTSEWDGKDAELKLSVEEDEPKGTEEELSKVKDVLGTFTTSYSSSGGNRSGNVANGARLINGTLLYPGDEFSTYETVSPFSEENGYYLAGSYNNGMVVETLGGGICQVSTTLYNAVLRAELEVTQRSNHSMIVTYVDPSCDAAISGTTKDFKFVNTSKHPVYIEGFTTSDKHITFTIYGVEDRPANREVIYESETLSRTEPQGERLIPDSTHPVGYYSTQSAHVGYTAQLWKIVKVDGKEESREVINKSTYAATPRTVTVGTASADPNVSAAVNSAIASGSLADVQAAASGGVVGAPTDPSAAAAAAAAQQAAIQAQQRAIAEAAAAAAQAAAAAAQ